MKKIICCIIALLIIISGFGNVQASNESIPLTNSEVRDIIGENPVTYSLDNNGNVVIVYPYKSSSGFFKVLVKNAAGGILGYVIVNVIDGIVESVSGKTGGEWIQEATKYLVGKAYQGIITLVNKSNNDYSGNCGIYPPNSEAGANCP